MSKTIHIDNYEAFLLDFMEGNLSEEDCVLLKDFISAHPELEVDLNDLELISLETEGVYYAEKSGLKKKSPFISEETYVAYIENTISAEEKKMVDEAVSSDAGVKHELDLYFKTLVAPDLSVVFDNKALLKREPKVLRFATTLNLSAAAALILILGLWFLFRDTLSTTVKGLPVASVEVKPKFRMPVHPEAHPQKTTNGTSQVPFHGIAKRSDTNSVETPPETSTVTANPVATNNFSISIPHKHELALPLVKDTILSGMALNPSKELKPVFNISFGNDEEETLPVKQEKKGFWAWAGKTFRNLNKLGVKKVNAVETVDTKKEEYVLSLGNFSVKKNNYNQD